MRKKRKQRGKREKGRERRVEGRGERREIKFWTKGPKLFCELFLICQILT
jgi:hypothetical protein